MYLFSEIFTVIDSTWLNNQAFMLYVSYFLGFVSACLLCFLVCLANFDDFFLS